MSAFCPDGYVPAPEAVASAAQHWYAGELPADEAAAGEPDALRQVSENIDSTVRRLRAFLHEGKRLKAYYFGGLFDGGRHTISQQFWATPEADGVLEAGTYFPFGRPSRRHEQRPGYRVVLLLQKDLDALLNEPQAASEPQAAVPIAKKAKPKPAELLTFLREHPGLGRKQQRHLASEQWQFTDREWREAVRADRRKPGPSKRK